MLARKEEISLQLNQIIDSFLLAILFWFSWWLRFNGHEWWELRPIAEFKEFLWVMAIIVPFMPLVLELIGFYRNPLQKTFWDSLRQLFQASIYLGVAIGVGVIFLQFDAASRSVLLIAAMFGGSALLLREKAYQLYLRQKLRRGELREFIIRHPFERVGGQGEAEGAAASDLAVHVDLATEGVDELASWRRAQNALPAMAETMPPPVPKSRATAASDTAPSTTRASACTSPPGPASRLPTPRRAWTH